MALQQNSVHMPLKEKARVDRGGIIAVSTHLFLSDSRQTGN